MFESIINLDLAHLLGGNRIGFYIPLLITLFTLYKFEVLKNINNDIILIFFISIIMGFSFGEHRIESIGNYEVEGFYSNNYFAALYLFWYGLILKEYNFNIPIIFCGVFLSYFFNDLIFVYFIKEESIFNENIGGAGFLDGLFVYPIMYSFVAYITRISIKYKINLEKERKNEIDIKK